MGLRQEWLNIGLMVKTQQCFNYYSLNDLYNVLKAHDSEVNEIAEETKVNLGGPCALVSKGFGREIEKEPKRKENEENKEVKSDEVKVKKKLKGDSGVDCHYCNGANHMANDCMLRKRDEKKNKVKDEAYYVEILEEVLDGAYDSILSDFDEAITYVNNLLIFASNDAKNSSTQLLETQRKLESKIAKIDHLELQITNVMCDRDSLSNDNKILLKQRNIYCNTAKRLYGKLIALHHSLDISKEQHMKLLPFLAYEREKIDSMTYDCEIIVAEMDKEKEVIDCSQFSVINVISMTKGKEKFCDLDHVTVEDSQTDSDDDNDVVPKETIISRVVVDQVFDETKKLDKILKEKGNCDTIKPEFRKMVKEDYMKASKDGFSQIKCKKQIEKISKESGISKRQERKNVFWQIIESRKKSNDLINKSFEKKKSKSVKNSFIKIVVNKKNPVLTQNKPRNDFSKKSKSSSPTNDQTSNAKKFSNHQ
ncbi:uncharacterized protein LOC111896263 [Lactuca sativa]|uniref:uncharacterized protein LOC111896263 n=1 Tax=Lactuca sativa TaxID=4236 RepID=UPI000CD8CD7B|nr:uncharacterized protein LOC111896263 [Lactuca sativa]